MDIDECISNLKNIDIKSIVISSIDENRYDLIKLQQDQMKHGIAATGKKIGKYKNKKYAAKKHQQNPLPGLGYKDEILTGSFNKDIFVDARNEGVTFSSMDEKTTEIIDRDGEDIFGLSKPYIEQFTPTLEQTANEKIQKKIYGM